MADFSYLLKYIIIGDAGNDFLLIFSFSGAGKSCLLM